jgi:hypothetical protein
MGTSSDHPTSGAYVGRFMVANCAIAGLELANHRHHGVVVRGAYLQGHGRSVNWNRVHDNGGSGFIISEHTNNNIIKNFDNIIVNLKEKNII